MVAFHDLSLVEATGQDDWNVWREFTQGRQCLPAIHAWHGQVAKDATNFILAQPEHFHSIDSVLRFNHRITQMFEHGCSYIAHMRIIFDQQHLAASFHYCWLWCFDRLPAYFFGRYRQKDPEYTSSSKFALHRDSPAV